MGLRTPPSVVIGFRTSISPALILQAERTEGLALLGPLWTAAVPRSRLTAGSTGTVVGFRRNMLTPSRRISAAGEPERAAGRVLNNAYKLEIGTTYLGLTK